MTEQPRTWRAYGLVIPQWWPMGDIGSSRVFATCCECSERTIAGYLATAPDWQHIGIKAAAGGLYKPTVYCRDHFDALLERSGMQEERVSA